MPLSPTITISESDCYEALGGHACPARSFAWCQPARQRVFLARRALSLPMENIIGLLLHEIGHVYDPMWDDVGSERRADYIAERLSGITIRYDKKDVQTIGKGKPIRPSHLPQ